MNARVLIIGAILLVGVVAAADHSLAKSHITKAQSQSAEFMVDPSHSVILFKIRHFGVTNFYGRVNNPTGKFLLVDEPGASFVEIEVQTKFIDGGNDARNKFLAGPDFFNPREHPTATFKSREIKRIDESTWEAVGTFRMRGVDVPLTVQLQQYAEVSTSRFGYRAGFEATFVVSRSTFGMTTHLEENMLSDAVEITVSVAGARAS